MKTKILFAMALIMTIGLFAFGQANLRYMTPLNMSPAAPGVGDTVTFSVQMKAQSGAAVNARIIGGIDGTTIYDHTFGNIPAGETRDLSFTWPATAGPHTAWFHMDPDELTGDPYPENNYIEITFTVAGTPSGQPNLKPTVSYSPTNFEAGDTVTFTMSVKNFGVETAVISKLDIKQGSTLLQRFNIPSLAASVSSADRIYNWTAVCDAVINVVADAANDNTESNEGDNTWSRTMSCGGSGTLIPINPNLWAKLKLYALRPIPLPEPCLSCPDWHKIPNPGDPIEILDQISKKLGGLQKPEYSAVKQLWMQFLKNNNGFDPNAALEMIKGKATTLGQRNFTQVKMIRAFQNNLTGVLDKMADVAKGVLNVR
jgi:hypothetical protein